MKRYVYEGKTGSKLPDPLRTEGGTISPVTEDLFVRMGGTILDDGEPTPKEAVIASFRDLLSELAEQVEGISIAEFNTAAQTMHSGDLVAYARTKGVSEEIIAVARGRMLEILADALREGLTWEELITGAAEA